MNVWSLFTGVGGFDLGLERAGFDVTLQCEVDPWRRRVLASHFPNATLEEDVRLVRGEPGAADILCGGFPCQDLSVAGKRAGLDGSRSGLFFEFARIAGELELAERDGWVFLENVPGLLSSNGGRDFGIVLQTLADLGFAVGYRVLNSQFFGVPQRRRRVFIVGHSRAESARAVLFDAEGGGGSVVARIAEESEVAGTLGGGSGGRGWCDDLDRGGHTSLSGLGNGGADDNDAQAGRLIAHTLRSNERNTSQGDANYVIGVLGEQSHTLTSEGMDASEDGSGRGAPIVAAPLTSGTPKGSNQAGRRQEDDVNLVFHATQDPISEEGFTPALGASGSLATQTEASVRRLTPRECERLQGFPDDWTAIDGLPTYAQAKNGSWRCKEGTPDSRRYAAMGDAVTVNVIEQIAHRLMAVIV